MQNRLGAAIGIAVMASLLAGLQNVSSTSTITDPIPYQLSIIGAVLFLLTALLFTLFMRSGVEVEDKSQHKAS
ncbi:hypothetical protein [Cytobacillus purgationiresistens]|uniref:ABC-type Na+ efflux pump permease subunit n=1 Tax=Cytobacillus purgationiresistens TaxID=863449 RepID=A0ABU0ADT4_9BACI|nr:hypothetical protein [Cytobacillus purgationiresistens]MDQ0268265.1 ABC-type Na+ efflux pump permease subunit [Cytobacillus purgationiresistens]